MYENIRNQAIRGGGRRWELQAICYHGILQGLRLINQGHAKPTPKRTEYTRKDPSMTDAVMRQLTNMILTVQAESAHAY